MTTSHTVVKIEYDPRVSSSVLDLTDIIQDVLPKAQEYNEDLRIEITHRIESSNIDPYLTLRSKHLRNSDTKIEVVLSPLNSIRRDVMTDRPIIINELDHRINLILSGYRFKIFAQNQKPQMLLTNRAYSITDIEIVVESEQKIRITQNEESYSNKNSLQLNQNALDLLKGKNNRIRALEHLHLCVDNDFSNKQINNPKYLSTPALIVGIVESIDHSRIRIDSDIEFESCVYGGIVSSITKMINSVEVTINGNVRYNNSQICGIFSGLTTNLSDSSIKIRGSVVCNSSNVIGMMVGAVSDISGDIRVDVRERVLVDTSDQTRQIGIVSGMSRRQKGEPLTTYSNPPRMLYDLTFLENTFRRKTIEGSQNFTDIGTFSVSDVDRAINSMVDFETGVLRETMTKIKSDYPKSIDTLEQVNEIIKDQVTNKFGDSNRIDNNDNCGGIFLSDHHVETERKSIFERSEITEADEIKSIIEETRRAIREKKGTIKKSTQSKSKQSKSKPSKTRQLKTRPLKSRQSKIRQSRTRQRDKRKVKYSVKRERSIPSEHSYHTEESVPILYDRRSNHREVNLYNPPTPKKSVEQEEEEVFRTIAVKRAIDDRRLSKEREARETRIGRLKRSLRTF